MTGQSKISNFSYHKTAFIFSGLGAQWKGMGASLVKEKIFQEKSEQYDKWFSAYINRPIAECLLADDSDSEAEDRFTTFAVQLYLTEILARWGIKPDAVAGHSYGEFAASCIAGILRPEDAVRIIWNHYLLAKKIQDHKMLFAALSAKDIQIYLNEYTGISVAAVNGPLSTVVSGKTHEIEDLRTKLEQKEVFCRVLKADTGYHTPLLKPYMTELQNNIGKIQVQPSKIPIYSTLYGKIAEAGLKPYEDCDYNEIYWAKHICEPVLFEPVIQAMFRDGCNVFIEISPHPVLSGSIHECFQDHKEKDYLIVHTLKRDGDGKKELMTTAALLSSAGYNIDFGSMNADETEFIKSICPGNIQAVKSESEKKTEAYLIRCISDLTGEKTINPDENFMDIGLDSVALIKLAEHLESVFKIRLSPTLFFTYKNIKSVAAYITDSKTKTSEVLKPSEVLADSSDACIAVIGISGFFPGANDPETFWHNLAQEKDMISEIPAKRWDWRAYGENGGRWGGFIEGIDKFDPFFFSISNREANSMDPQQRILLQVVWNTIENAGYNASALSGTHTGIFIGAAASDYAELAADASVDAYTSIGTNTSVLANRISYLLNLHGPSETINTACSSSLVAVHHAVTALRNQECEIAIAGGVNALLSPILYVSFVKAGMLSPDGRCKTFDRNANGYVRGEGAGAILLKPLNKALADNDHIWGIIKATEMNHGGHSNSFTAPNPDAQANLLIRAYEQAKTDPTTIGYIECHGTGTELGDPLEVQGLTTAFKTLYAKWNKPEPQQPHCGLGSVKTNIGHLESAAGIAGLIKILLCFQHQQLPSTLHFKELNPYINLQNTPFYIVDKTQEWQSLTDDKGQIVPRRAGVSSFGFGGTNAHIVLEEYNSDARGVSPLIPSPNDSIIVLSAKNGERLKDYARKLADFLMKNTEKFLQKEVTDIAYTLQTGREAMNERLAIVVSNKNDLIEKLMQYGQGNKNIDGLFTGNAKTDKGKIGILLEDEDGKEFFRMIITKRRIAKIAQLWVLGADIEWNLLYQEKTPNRIPLPTYPFTRERYWIPEKAQGARRKAQGRNDAAVLHPLLHQNTSDLSDQRFSSTFTGEEFFLADHVVKGNRVLPGAAHLEMVRAAIERAAGNGTEGIGIRLKNVVWARPVVVSDEPVKLNIGLFPEENGEIAFDVYSESDGEEPIVFSQGHAVLIDNVEIPKLDIRSLQAECNQGIFESERCYEIFTAQGIDYGAGFRGIEKVYVGMGCVLAKLRLPSSVSETLNQFILHPSLMDAALQASVGLMTGPDSLENNGSKPALPFALESLDIFANCTDSMWAVVRENNGGKIDTGIQKLDIDLCSEDGKVCARMSGFSSRVLEENDNTSYPKDIEIQYMDGKRFIPDWREAVTGPENTIIPWKDGGMPIDAASEQMMTQSTGMVPMNTKTGIHALYRCMASDSNRMLAAEGNMKKMKQKLLEPPKKPDIQLSQNTVSTTADTKSLNDQLKISLVRTISELLKIRIEDINEDVEWSEFGFDSISIAEMSDRLNDKYQLELMPTIFFEYSTIRNFLKYLTDHHGNILAPRFAKPIMNRISESETANEKLLTKRHRHFSRFSSALVFTQKKNSSEPVAIIGMSGIFPMSETIDEFWKNLVEGKDCITEIPPDRWDWREWYGDPMTEANKTDVIHGGFIEGVYDFDPLFFGISPKEAELMDPQQRLIMTYAWKAIEDAGYSPRSLAGTNTAVFVGTGVSSYGELLSQGNTDIEAYSSTGRVPSVGPNRLSYFLDIHGPSEPIETACSSSLVALDHAVSAIRNENCDMAIAGGVNTILTPYEYISLSKAGLLSKDGKCKTFSENADGYVRGEGVGMLFLKRLKDAQQAGDHIYGLILGTAENHGGRTNSLTAPNPKVQAEVLKSAFTKAGIDPKTIGYIEAHGTGTKLGDPIEIEGLKTAFKDRSQSSGYSGSLDAHCGLGSVKTNIGHLELSAGIAGVIKVLLQMKYKTLVKSLHCDKMNPYIKLEETPFYIVREKMDWKPLKNDNGEDIPRRAGVSSFGFGGTNAHVIIEEYVEKNSEFRIQNSEFLIVLSAKNEERLREQAERLLASIRERELSNDDLPNIAYTLQVGREAMNERLSLIVRTSQELEQKLKDFLEHKQDIDDSFMGQVKQNKDTLAVLIGDDEFHETVDKWIQRKKYSKLLELWVKGLNFDWKKLYGEQKPRRISLPTYPFAKERYWVTIERKTQKIDGKKDTAILHPLLHINTSDLSQQRFSSIFTGEEFFLADHVVKGSRVLPGVAYLEMERAAIERAAGDGTEGIGIRLKNVVWARPVVVSDEPVKLNIGLFPEENGEIAFEVYSESDGEEPIVFSQGHAVLIDNVEIPKLDIRSLQAECNQGIFESERCYEIFTAQGIDYGAGFRGIEKVYVGMGCVLAKLRLPSSVSETLNQFILHPSLMDAALQASVGLMTGPDSLENNGSKPALPFALESLDIFANCTDSMWAVVRENDGGKIDTRIQKLDIDLCSEDGKVCARMSGFSSRVLEENIAAEKDTIGTLLLEPLWKEQSVEVGIQSHNYSSHIIFLCEFDSSIASEIESRIPEVRCIHLKSYDQNITERYSSYAIQIFEEIQRVIKNKLESNVLIQVIVPLYGEGILFRGLAGLLKTARLENSKIIAQLISIDTDTNAGLIIERMNENTSCPKDIEIQYRDGKRFIPDWREAVTGPENTIIPWKEGGVYLITGGAGGLGLIFVQEIAAQLKKATLILTGRSPIDDKKKIKIEELESSEVKIIYRQADVTQKDAVIQLVKNILDDFGKLDGIIHAAGIIRDNFIIKKSAEEFREVLAPKVMGLVNLDKAAKDLPLDFFILFSSGAGPMGNIGQADYACANAFMDAYAEYRQTLKNENKRQGRMLSVNWPLWKEGGMRIDSASERMMTQSTGMVSMGTQTGIQALYRCMTVDSSQVLAVEGKIKKLKQKLLVSPSESDIRISENTVSTSSDTEAFYNQMKKTLVKTISEFLKIRTEDMDEEAEWSEFGFDSISITEMANRLNDQYQLELMPTIFFEYPTIRSFFKYLTDHHGKVFASQFVKPINRITESETAVKKTSAKRRKHFSRFSSAPAFTQKKNPLEPVAIVGMSGIFPMAKTIDEFWKNLVEGKDCISEIPPDRWDWREWYGDPMTESNKTDSIHGGFIDGVYDFDPLFFRISPKEAELMDPQQRLIMMYAWKAVEDAGYSPRSLAGSNTGVFVGTGSSGYAELLSQGNNEIQAYSSTGAVPSVGPNRLSYFLDIHGPSEPVETACSSSLIALHRAVGAIRNENCDMAIVGGVNTILTPAFQISFSKAGMLSKDGKSKTFSDNADGYVRGEGVGMLFLKRLKDAEQSGDHIYGVILGTAENHGGRTNSLTAPNPKAQAEVLKSAYTNAGINPKTIGYIETHGTGTKLGDPIEIEGLKTAFKDISHPEDNLGSLGAYCGLGSVKTNIGHLELSAGIASVIKVLLQMKYKTLVKSLHCDKINSYIQLDETPFYIVREKKDWEPLKNKDGEDLPRRAGVSSFGFGGANAHVVIEEYVKKHSAFSIQHSAFLIVLSAKNEDRLREQAEELLASIRERKLSNDDLPDIAYTLQIGREAMNERLALIVRSSQELEQKLEDFLEGKPNIDDCFKGQVKQNKDTLADLTGDDEFHETVDKWIQRKKYSKLLELWVKGLNFDWNKLYGEQKPRRISLPTYPFARERYWIAEKVEGKGQKAEADSAEPEVIETETDATGLSSEITEYLTSAMSVITKVEHKAIDPDENFEMYGLDSLMISQFNSDLERQFGKLPSTLLFTYKNINSLSEYFRKNHSEKIQSLFKIKPRNMKPTREKNRQNRGGSKPTTSDYRFQPIAIIGLSGQYPLSETLDEFWENLKKGKDCIVEIPEERWDYREFPEMYCKWGGFLKDIDKFDPQFFNISPAEARFMDPQERLYLQAAWSCIEDAGYTLKRLEDSKAGDRRGNVGVFAGVTFNQYQLYYAEEWNKGNFISVGSQICSVANRVSYFLNLRGPSLSVDTACSSSLYAIHLACESIMRGECEMAIAGGVNLSLHPAKYVTLCKTRFASSDGRCRAFGEGGDGYVPGEAVGAVLLKPLHQAKSDRDHIYAVIKGTAVNHDGRTHGYSVPNPVAQTEVIKTVIEKSGIDPRTISCVEAHGTGTSLGDPIEITALSEAYNEYTDERQYCVIGSIKSNIGHPEAAAGIAQLTKVLLQMKYKTLVPTLKHSERVNPNIDLKNSPFFLQETAAEWKQPFIGNNVFPRRAAISSFGFSGVNVHAVIEEYEEKTDKTSPVVRKGDEHVLIPISAKTRDSLKAYVGKFGAFMKKRRETETLPDLRDVAHTFQTGREAMNYRAAFVVKTSDELIENLDFFLTNGSDEEKLASYRIFTGTKNKLEPLLDGDRLFPIPADLARRWSRGENTEWEALCEGYTPRRISLPTYAFLKERYWLTESSGYFKSEYMLSSSKSEKAHPSGKNTIEEKDSMVSFLEELAEAPDNVRKEMLVGFLHKKCGEILGFVSPSLPDLNLGFFEMGMDSLLTVQFQTEIGTVFHVKLSDTAAFDYPNIMELSDHLIELIPFDEIGNIVETLMLQPEEQVLEEIDIHNMNFEVVEKMMEFFVDETGKMSKPDEIRRLTKEAETMLEMECLG